MAGNAGQSIGAALLTFGSILCVAALVALVWAGMLFMRLAEGGYQFQNDAGEVAGAIAGISAAVLLVGALVASVGAGLWASGRAAARVGDEPSTMA